MHCYSGPDALLQWSWGAATVLWMNSYSGQDAVTVIQKHVYSGSDALLYWSR